MNTIEKVSKYKILVFISKSWLMYLEAILQKKTTVKKAGASKAVEGITW